MQSFYNYCQGLIGLLQLLLEQSYLSNVQVDVLQKIVGGLKALSHWHSYVSCQQLVQLELIDNQQLKDLTAPDKASVPGCQCENGDPSPPLILLATLVTMCFRTFLSRKHLKVVDFVGSIFRRKSTFSECCSHSTKITINCQKSSNFGK